MTPRTDRLLRPGAWARALAVAALALGAAGCAFPVEGRFSGRSLGPGVDPKRTIVVIFNHGFAREAAGTFKATIPPIVERAAKNDDVVVFAQVRNTTELRADDHASYVQAAVAWFQRQHGIPVENIILTGQSCGGWGSLQAAAFAYPNVGGVVAFAPTCHGKLPHSTATRLRRQDEIAQLAARVRFAGTVFLYEGDSYYDLEDWAAFEARVHVRGFRIVKLPRERVLELCPGRCDRDSHGAVWSNKLSAAYFDQSLQAVIERVRERIRARETGGNP